MFRKLVLDDCDKKRNFICSTSRADLAYKRSCPAGYRRYKKECIFISQELGNYKEKQVDCAAFGAILMPIKDKATYKFIQSLGQLKKYKDLYLGMNFSLNLDNPMYSDNTVFNRSIHFEFDSESSKFGAKECVYLKKGVSYKPRSIECDVPMQAICLWRSIP